MNNQQRHLDQPRMPKQRRGIALMLVMVAILVTGAMAVAYFGSRDNSIAISRNVEASTRARVVAESGLDLAVAILQTDADWRTGHVEGVLLSEYAITGGTITLTLMDLDTSFPPTESTMSVQITVLAEVEGLFQVVKANATVIPDNDDFDVDFSEFAIFAQSLIEIDGASSLQLWSASLLALQQQSILLGTLSTSPMSVLINSNNQQVELELYVTEDASSMVTNSDLNVLLMSETPPFPSPPAAPLSGLDLYDDETDHQDTSTHGNGSRHMSSGNSSVDFGFGSGQIDVQSGTYLVDDLELHSGETLAIHGDVIIGITGDLVLRHAAVVLDDDASLTIHVGGNASIVTSYLGNNNQSMQSYMDPNRLQLFGHNDSEWVFSGLTTMKGEIYAPESEVELRGMTTICGRIAADEVTLRGASRLLYDPVLDNGGFADFQSSLYDDDGALHTELFQLTSLDQSLISSILRSITVLDEGYENQYVNDWLTNPTDRINEVIYFLLVYGVDAHRWEELAHDANFPDNSAYARAEDR